MSDWDAQLKKIDKQLESMSDSALIPAAPKNAPPAVRAKVAEERATTRTWGAFLRLALATALGRALGLPPLGACFFGSFLSDFGDKAVTFALVTSVLHGLPRRTAARFPWALRAIGAA